MKFKTIPALTMTIFGFAMYLLDRFLPVGDFDFFGREPLQYVVLALGFLILAAALYQFKKAQTTVDPLNPDKASTLVSKGIFNYTRNPMYLAMLLLLIAFGLKLGNAFNTILAAGFVYYMNHFQIKHEEDALTKKFGKEYKLYCKAVRRWF